MRKYIYSVITLVAIFNLGTKLYTHESGPIIDNYLTSCLISLFVVVYFGISAFNAWRYDD